MRDNQKFVLLVFGLALFGVVIGAWFAVQGDLEAIVRGEVRQTYDQMRTVP